MVRTWILLTGCIVTVLVAGSASAQKRNAHWFLGNSWVTFQSGTPVLMDAAVPGPVRATLSDTSGNLRVYYRAYSPMGVFASNHQLIGNHPELEGVSGLRQSAIFVPKPGDPESCFLLLWNRLQETEEWRWGILEIHLGPLGTQPTAVDSIQWFMPNAMHKSMVVPHANGEDYWFITQERGTFVHHAYRISIDGIVASPVIGPAGMALQSEQEYGILVPSRSGQWFISTNEYFAMLPPVPTKVALHHFDPATGAMEVSTELPDLLKVSGAEFSPGSRYLYVTDRPEQASSNSVQRLFQYDLVSEDLLASRVLVHSAGLSAGYGNTTSVLHLAPDGKIYRAYATDVDHLGVIEAPDEGGYACGFVPEAFQCLEQVISLPSFAKRYHDDPGPGTVAMPEARLPDHPRLWPNPMRGEGWLHWPGAQGAVELEWLDLRGRVVQRIQVSGSDSRVPLHAGGLAEGIYLLRCRTEARQQVMLRVAVAR